MAEPARVPVPAQLGLLSHAKLEPSAHGDLLTCNPIIELFASAAGPKTLQIWRNKGQVVIKSSQRGEKESVQALCWKADGQFLAVGWSDGVVRLLGLETNKAVHQIPVCEAAKSSITCIAWARNHVAGRSLSSAEALTSALQGLQLDGGEAAGKRNKLPLDLPRELIFLEIETALPKISPLPASGGSGDDMYVFTTRSSLEFLFQPFSPESSDKVDVMVVGTEDGRIHLSIYDSFVIGSFQYSLPPTFGAGAEAALAYHASHPTVSTHSLVFKPSAEEKPKSLCIVPLDLTFLYASPENLSLLASKITSLQKLLRYVKQVQVRMTYEYLQTRDLPGKFLTSINETLKDAGSYNNMGIGQAMYHTVVTGHTFPEVKEWLVDQLTPRGHKRWDHNVVSGLEGLRSLVHENFLPALERIAIILSRLLGIARFHQSRDDIGFNSAQITQVMDIVSCMMLVGNKILLLVMEELDLFQSFSTWLQYEIDHLASSSTTDELSETEATMEHGKILKYIQQYLLASPLGGYVSKVAKEDLERDLKLADNGPQIQGLLDKQIKKQECGQPQTGVFSQVEFLCTHVTDKANAVFEGIAEAEKRSVRFGHPTKIELEHNLAKLDVTMSKKASKGTLTAVTYMGLTQEQEPSNVHLYRTETNVINGISGAAATTHTCLTLGEAKILDLKFLNEGFLLVLLSLKDQLNIIMIPQQTEELGYSEYIAGAPVTPRVLSTQQVNSVFPTMIVPQEAGAFMPVQMEVKTESSERGKMPARICLLGQDRQTYRVFALPEDFSWKRI